MPGFLGLRLYLVGTRLYLIGTDLYLDFLGKVACLDFWAQDFNSKIEVKICAYEVKISRASEVKSCAYEVKIPAYEVKNRAYEVKSRVKQSRNRSLPRSSPQGDTLGPKFQGQDFTSKI